MNQPVPPIAIVDKSARLFLAHSSAGQGWSVTLLAEQGAWPAWSPEGSSIAASVLDAAGGTSSIEVLDLDGRPLRSIRPQVQGRTPVIAPGVPHYLNWSPGGRYLSYVSPGDAGLELRVSDSASLLSGDLVAQGAPIFSTWSPDERYLAVHVNTELRLYDVESWETVATFERAAGFRTAAFTATGESLLYATPATPGVSVTRVDLPGLTTREVARFTGGVALLPRPGSTEVAVAVAQAPDQGLFDEVWPDVSAPGPLLRGPLAAALWSPDGAFLAVHTPAQSGDGRYAVRVVDAQGRFVAASEAIFPSGPYRMMLAFFDQYMYSHRTWSPDSATVLLGGRLPGDGVHATFGDPSNAVLSWRVASHHPVEVVHEGEVGFFPAAATPT